MNIEELREYCLSKKDAEESFPFGIDTLVFKVNGKIFAIAGLDKHPVSANLKCNPEKAAALRQEYDCVKPGYHMNKKHWNTVLIDGTVSKKLITEWIDDSYNLVSSPAKKKK